MKNMRYTIQALSLQGERGPEQSVVAPPDCGVYVAVPVLGQLKILAEPTRAPADDLPLITDETDTRTLEEFAADLLTGDEAELSEADQIAALLRSAGLPVSACYQVTADERRVVYQIEVLEEVES